MESQAAASFGRVLPQCTTKVSAPTIGYFGVAPDPGAHGVAAPIAAPLRIGQ